MSNKPDLKEIEAFLYHEADLLDSLDLKPWIELFTEDGDYWMPVTPDQEDPLNHISIFYDDRAMMTIRYHNLDHAQAPSKQYPVRSSHILGNIRLLEHDGATGNCTVKSNFQAVVFYQTQTVFAGTCTHTLVREGDSYKIKRKRVDLINCDDSHGSIINYI
ncbi:aromatic-ring-hydroxylating dioxygenase subunit beta [Emcibacter sp.]|uniref:aromatic-ring-hydroxylating dioxygenase subunit beta n=1 Tax=Emcibacter sp. TaxID=1979954 RepID=UPI003A8CFD52